MALHSRSVCTWPLAVLTGNAKMIQATDGRPTHSSWGAVLIGRVCFPVTTEYMEVRFFSVLHSLAQELYKITEVLSGLEFLRFFGGVDL